MKLVKNATTYLDGVALKPEILRAMAIIDQVHKRVVLRQAEFTSTLDGVHSRKSLHYMGMAVDMRIWYLVDVGMFVDILKSELGPDYIVLEKPDHIHISFRPRRG